MSGIRISRKRISGDVSPTSWIVSVAVAHSPTISRTSARLLRRAADGQSLIDQLPKIGSCWLENPALANRSSSTNRLLRSKRVSSRPLNCGSVLTCNDFGLEEISSHLLRHSLQWAGSKWIRRDRTRTWFAHCFTNIGHRDHEVGIPDSPGNCVELNTLRICA
jgi:hypothetical protein